jgi:hypothetical protein
VLNTAFSAGYLADMPAKISFKQHIYMINKETSTQLLKNCNEYRGNLRNIPFS